MLQDQLVLCMHSWYHLPASCFFALVGAGRGSNYSTGWECLCTAGMAAPHSTPLGGGLGSLALTLDTATLRLFPLFCKVLTYLHRHTNTVQSATKTVIIMLNKVSFVVTTNTHKCLSAFTCYM